MTYLDTIRSIISIFAIFHSNWKKHRHKHRSLIYETKRKRYRQDCDRWRGQSAQGIGRGRVRHGLQGDLRRQGLCAKVVSQTRQAGVLQQSEA